MSTFALLSYLVDCYMFHIVGPEDEEAETVITPGVAAGITLAAVAVLAVVAILILLFICCYRKGKSSK